MKDTNNTPQLINAGSAQRADRLLPYGLRVLAAGVVLGMLATAAAQWMHRDQGASHAATGPAASMQPGPERFDYFPERYENRATEVEEHIQAF